MHRLYRNYFAFDFFLNQIFKDDKSMILFRGKKVYANNKNQIYFQQNPIFAGKLKFKKSEPIF